MDRDLKLAAARKKLNKFQKKKGNKGLEQKKRSLESSKEELRTGTASPKRNGHPSTEDKREDFLSETPQSTDTTAENIFQLSVKLNAIAAEADMLSDDGNSDITENGGKVVEYDPSKEVINTLESRNLQLADNIAALTREKEDLNCTCQNLSDQVKELKLKLSESQNQGFENDTLRQQLQVQMQTIGVLVSEKQDLQQELLATQSKIKSSETEQKKIMEEFQTAKTKVMTLERELEDKVNTLGSNEQSTAELQNEKSFFEAELGKMKQMFEQEQMRASELHMKLQARENEYKQLYASHLDAQEKLGMADVLLKQMTAGEGSDSVTQVSKLQKDIESLSLQLNNYQHAFEQLTSERDQLKKQYGDAELGWNNHIQELQSTVQSLENEKLILSEHNDQLQRSLDEKAEPVLNDDASVPPVVETPQENDDSLFDKIDNALHEEIEAQRLNNQHLSQLVHEKEARICELENELEQATSYAREHEQLVDSARNDKATISRALLQNKQLKQQLEEIQEGFVRMSNDKMDLATQVSSLEHSVKDLQLHLHESTAARDQMHRDLEYSNTQVLHFQQQIQALQSNAVGNQMAASEDNSEMVNEMKRKMEVSGEQIENLASENMQLKNQLGAALQIIENYKNAPETVGNGENSQAENPDTVAPEGSENNVASNVEAAPKLEPEASDHETLPAQTEISPDALIMLQDKFTSVMNEKAELLNRLELLEHANTQLQNECDTIGEYIALYHNQRQVLRQRHHEKDEYISNIIQEREAMKGKVEQLQTLIVAMLNNRGTPERPDYEDAVNVSPKQTENEKSRLSESQPDLVPKTDFTMNSNPEEGSVENEPIKTESVSESSNPGREDVTTTQILDILKQMQKPVDPSIYAIKSSIPSGFCMQYIGPYTAI